jgi:hypothetical protein
VSTVPWREFVPTRRPSLEKWTGREYDRALRLVVVITILLVTFVVSMYIHQRTVRVSRHDPSIARAGRVIQPRWQDPVAALIAFSGCALAAAVALTRRKSS